MNKTEHCKEVQQESLRRLLELNADSRFSHEHGIDRVRTVEEFRKQLPVTDYEFVRSAIDEVKNGDHRALLGSKNRLLMFSLSSGTTSESKFIPITEQFLSDYRRGWQSWGIMAMDAHREVNALNIVQITSDFDRFRTPGGTPCGNISGLVIAMQRPIVRLMYSVPGIVAKITDPEAKQYAAIRLAVADRNVGMITTANPSTLLNLANMANTCREELVRDLYDGTISSKYEIDASIRRQLRWLSRRRRSRARELESIIEQTGTLYPKDFWPRTQIMAVWTGGSAGVYLKYLKPLYGDVAMRDHGLHASEGRMTIPLEDGTASGVLDISTHFFEFIPEA
ncbi:MAG: GH3 auxin-responsive promoter family protein, partial [Planctomycetota bacterium]|nr:GH3 auxin-responsive promoter family protein [Planctomycetota bacterium]